jgi:hypothetical protein
VASAVSLTERQNGCEHRHPPFAFA